MEWASGNIYIRKNLLPAAGDRVDGHKHNFDHTTIVFTGAVHVTARLPGGEVIERDFAAPDHFLVRADVEHLIVATESGTEFWCVYSHRAPQGDVVQAWTGWEDAVR